jgi:hypothetical protein
MSEEARGKARRRAEYFNGLSGRRVGKGKALG